MTNTTTTMTTRQILGRIFGSAALVWMIWFGLRFYKNAYPVEIQLRYVYQHVPKLAQLRKVRTRLSQKSHTIATATFFHPPGTSAAANSRTTQRQKLALPQGKYMLRARLHYQDNSTRTLRQPIELREEGGSFYIYLRKAKPRPAKSQHKVR